jgi:hypothetical protein
VLDDAAWNLLAARDQTVGGGTVEGSKLRVMAHARFDTHVNGGTVVRSFCKASAMAWGGDRYTVCPTAPPLCMGRSGLNSSKVAM